MKNFYKLIIYDNSADDEDILSKDEFLDILSENYSEEEINKMTSKMKHKLYIDEIYSLNNCFFEDTIDEVSEMLKDKVFLANCNTEGGSDTSTKIDLVGFISSLSSYKNFKEFFFDFSKYYSGLRIGITKDNKLFIECSNDDATKYAELKIVTPKGRSLLSKFSYYKKLQQYSDKELLNKMWKSKVYSEKLHKDCFLEM